MKKFLLGLTLTVLGVLLFTGSTFAQSTETEAANFAVEDFQLGLTRNTQSPVNKNVKLNLEFSSRFDTKTAFIRWKAPNGLEILGREEFQTSFAKDQTYTFTQKIRPTNPGTYRITAEVEAWQPEAVYIDSEQIDITFDENLQITPLDAEYPTLNILWQVGRVVGILLILAGIGFGALFGYKKFRVWLAKD